MRDSVSGVSVCRSTGNLVVMVGDTLVVYKYTLATQNKNKYIDFEECLHVGLDFCPDEVKIVEDTIACINRAQVHMFKIKVVDAADTILRSPSCYSFSSESESSLDVGQEKVWFSLGPYHSLYLTYCT